MAHWVRFNHGGTTAVGTLEGDTIAVHSGTTLVEAGAATGDTVKLSDVELLAPTDPTKDPTTTAGGAIIMYDPAAARTRTSPEFDRSTGVTSTNPADPGIVLAHEQIHASHIQAGQISGMGAATYTGLDGTPHTSMDEEARTVGVGGTPRPDDITENQLRDMIGILPRNNYSPFRP